ncbi:MAG TPA: serine hydrolase [Candidatus Saccharimonadales bacterium]
MTPKQKLVSIDVFAFAVTASLVLILYASLRVVSLVQPANINFSLPQTKLPVIALQSDEDESINQARIMNQFKDALDKILSDFDQTELNSVGVFVEHLPSSLATGINDTKQFITASLYKPFAALEALKLVDAKTLSGSSVLADAGGRTLDKCIWDSITVSDNPCGHALLSLTDLTSNQGLGRLHDDGYKQTDMRGLYPVSTARDIGRLFQHIYRVDLLGKNSNKQLTNALLAQTINDRLSTGLAPGDKLAHKTGDLEGYAHDGGIVYSKTAGDYIIVVLTGPDAGRTLGQRYARFGQLLKSLDAVMGKFNAQLDPESA